MDRGTLRLLLIGLAIAIVVAVGASQFASDNPDGLEFVAEQEGFADAADDHDLSGSPLAEYGEDLTGNAGVNTAVAGLVGVLVTLGLGYGVFWLTRRIGNDHTTPGSEA